ncbi:asparagine synthase (glutamine-hydrolyzing) [Calorimonas adulescens]|jgi:asparagine synthase (glutamine-hydrolyzing)|uniref:asparagine synthase (glutamine-hydrolyzing) n=1 Tax=Calorimonas adulescens TaxID=2606906 RepID=A0A5D8QCU1_9THEO|nr:asparagine synthase (glutamine-hydrolyzing) [Calorimonas adulescens]TZE81158.1 asparagine synthase (glutamine-hydrolyzing) [Calorimonas adulescens]
MCGIAGWIDFERNLVDEDKIAADMANTMSHRGPDAYGVWLKNHVAFSHRRLIVVDPAGGGQPMTKVWGENEYTIVYNGELYNTEDIRAELKLLGYTFMSYSDTEVLLTSYIEWGPDCLDRLNGIFAFGIWDERNQRLFMARDRMGVKPLFYTVKNGSLIFASEIKGILAHPYIEPVIDETGLAEVLAIGPGRTPGQGVFKGIKELRPGQALIYSRDGLKVWRYWSFKSIPHRDDFETTAAKVRELVVDSVKRQLVSDVPVCTFLSGGLDSSAITAIASKAYRDKGSILDSYSVDYVDNEKYFKSGDFQPDADFMWVDRVSHCLGTNHHKVYISNSDLADALTDAVRIRDLPGMADVDSSLLLFCREIKKGATVALSGECADEIFGGYPWFRMKEALEADTFPWSLSLDERLKVISSGLRERIDFEGYVRDRYKETLNEVPQLEGEGPEEAGRRRLFYLNINWFMQTLLDRKDRMSMASGLEVRVPYCDHRIVEYVWNVPWDMKFHGGREKGLLREALKGILPDDVRLRKKSPYPKTHNPQYTSIVKMKLKSIMDDSASPLLQIVDTGAVNNLIDTGGEYITRPWYGQLMTGPQMMAYLIQVDAWLKENKVIIEV